MDAGPVGRADELSRPSGLVRAATGGRGGLAWVQGELGAGGSTLADEMTARADGCLVLRAAQDDAHLSGDRLALGYALHASTLVASAPEAVDRIDDALAVLGEDPESVDLRLLLVDNRLTYLAGLGRWEEALAALPGALVLAERAGSFRGASLLATAAEVGYEHGDWDDALVHLGGIDTEFVGNGSNLNPAGIGALIALHRGDQAAAETYLQVAGGGRRRPAGRAGPADAMARPVRRARSAHPPAGAAPPGAARAGRR
ncbi:hypothetical protein BBK82_05720 [Lentzea guizhouensis]|uniref:MalT-like TPR region domain-containing protein n=1 Tax=Lentzea guizhouensis TaxID=1586287 RepID=A0A1B2HD70_9PSEU|nr:ATP-binding protein [Lentzea guizhouensis]ANZ35649.1 hypothetical protein BBK82_05720 [Lentzea guizhouensis]